MTTETRDNEAATRFPVVIFADFVCPYSYLASEQVDRLAEEYDLQPLWRPHWLHPETPLEGMAYEPTANPERRKATFKWLQEMEPERAARMRMPEKRHFSFLAFEALEYAQDYGLALPFKSAVFDALWVEGKDIGQVKTLQEAAEKVGLDPDDLAAALIDPEYIARTIEAVETAARIGVANTPTFILGRTRMNGWNYYEVLQSILEKQGVLPKEVATEA
jgi:predicted DsbA family dithiol-disulfide isomerase